MSIREALVKRDLRKLDAQESRREAYEDRVRRLAESLKSQESGGLTLSAPVEVLRTAYYSYLNSYKRSHSFAERRVTKRAIALWERVEKAQRAAGVDASTFIEAQFVWFHKAFGKSPTLEQLTTEAAVERAKDYTLSISRPVSNDIKVEVDLSERWKQAEDLVQRTIEAQGCSRVEFYRKFVISRIFTLPKDFLKADPAYTEALNG